MSEQIPRGADLTDDDLMVLARDLTVVYHWAMVEGHKRDEAERQIMRAFRARLGRQPLVIDDAQQE